VRQDPTKDNLFATSELWDRQKYNTEYIVSAERAARTGMSIEPGRKYYSNSLSGSERNRLFLRRGDNYTDLSLNSGADDLNDGRSFCLLDFDGDGWQDIALMSLNVPRFKIYRNQLGDVFPDRKSVRFQLIGGQTGATESAELSNRDGVGARILVQFSNSEKLMMHRQSGEGYASQNSQVLSIGIPSGTSVEKVTVAWPSGKSTELDSPSTEEILVIREAE
jgi:hypothetical protein